MQCGSRTNPQLVVAAKRQLKSAQTAIVEAELHFIYLVGLATGVSVSPYPPAAIMGFAVFVHHLGLNFGQRAEVGKHKVQSYQQPG